jgi:hypothetical protein
VIGRSPGGKAQHVTLTPEGSQRASEIGKKWWCTSDQRIIPAGVNPVK